MQILLPASSDKYPPPPQSAKFSRDSVVPDSLPFPSQKTLHADEDGGDAKKDDFLGPVNLSHLKLSQLGDDCLPDFKIYEDDHVEGQLVDGQPAVVEDPQEDQNAPDLLQPIAGSPRHLHRPEDHFINSRAASDSIPFQANNPLPLITPGVVTTQEASGATEGRHSGYPPERSTCDASVGQQSQAFITASAPFLTAPEVSECSEEAVREPPPSSRDSLNNILSVPSAQDSGFIAELPSAFSSRVIDPAPAPGPGPAPSSTNSFAKIPPSGVVAQYPSSPVAGAPCVRDPRAHAREKTDDIPTTSSVPNFPSPSTLPGLPFGRAVAQDSSLESRLESTKEPLSTSIPPSSFITRIPVPASLSRAVVHGAGLQQSPRSARSQQERSSGSVQPEVAASQEGPARGAEGTAAPSTDFLQEGQTTDQLEASSSELELSPLPNQQIYRSIEDILPGDELEDSGTPSPGRIYSPPPKLERDSSPLVYPWISAVGDPSLTQTRPAIHSIPSRPDQTMSASPASRATSSEPSLKERLRNLRAASAANRTASATSQAAPAIGTTTPQPPSSRSSVASSMQPPQFANDKGELTAPRGQDITMGSTQHERQDIRWLSQFTQSVPSLDSPRLGTMEFAVPLGMSARVRDYYEQAVYNCKEDVETFLNARKDSRFNPDSGMTELLERVDNFSVHPDLEDTSVLRESSSSLSIAPSETETRWAEECSAKFRFLRNLLDLLRPHDTHIAILARPGPLLNILEKFLRGHNVRFSRPDRRAFSDKSAKGALQVTLLPTGTTGAGFVVSTASVVLAMDRSFKASDPQVVSLRAHLVHVGRLAPVLRLVVLNSAEHIERCIPAGLGKTLHLQIWISCVAQARNAVGKMTAEYPQALEAAKQVADWLVSGGDNADGWPLPPLDGVAGIDELFESQRASSSRYSSVHPQERTPGLDTGQEAQKRAFDSEDIDSAEAAKRQRLTPESDGITTPFAVPSKGEKRLDHQKQLTEERGVDMSSQRPSPGQIKVEADLRQRISELEGYVSDCNVSLSQSRDEYEELAREYRKLRVELDGSKRTTEQLEHRRDEERQELSRLRETHGQLERDLEEARTALRSSAVPEIAELEEARAAARRESAERARLEKRLESTMRDFEFTRTQYQSASTAAAESTIELTTMRGKFEVLERRANGEALELRRLNFAAQAERYNRELATLKRMLEDREAVLRRKEDANVTVGRTRSRGSIPSALNSPSPRPSPGPGQAAVQGSGLAHAAYPRV